MEEMGFDPQDRGNLTWKTSSPASKMVNKRRIRILGEKLVRFVDIYAEVITISAIYSYTYPSGHR
jgi:hypothetical protein